MSDIFSDCISLISLPDISKWDTKNVKQIDGIFAFCSKLSFLPDISKWDTSKIENMKECFLNVIL